MTDLETQSERTTQAWTRTGIALFINAMLALRTGVSNNGIALILVAMILIAAAVLATVYGTWRFKLLITRRSIIAAPVRIIQGVTGVTLLACAGVVASIIMDGTPW